MVSNGHPSCFPLIHAGWDSGRTPHVKRNRAMLTVSSSRSTRLLSFDAVRSPQSPSDSAISRPANASTTCACVPHADGRPTRSSARLSRSATTTTLGHRRGRPPHRCPATTVDSIEHVRATTLRPRVAAALAASAVPTPVDLSSFCTLVRVLVLAQRRPARRSVPPSTHWAYLSSVFPGRWFARAR